MLFRPAESSENIVNFYRNYLITTFQTNNEKYNKQLKEQLDEPGAISAGPYISLSDMYAKGKSPRELCNENILSSLICGYEKVHPDRTLYKHQEEAILKSNNNKNLVVTTGTGSGKTECFMFPILNSLLREKEKGTLDSGVRALLIYPMNALVNDQIVRLRTLFDGSNDESITFGRFTGETKEKYSDALGVYKARNNGQEPKANELISREQMRKTPPNILITNYAMLEYLLLRPGDNVFFNSDNSPKWKTIVFDEAHTYGGAKGIEVSTLIKRLKARLNRNDIQFILTSATLGDKNSNPEIIKFAESLCNAPFDDSSIIRSTTIGPEKADIIKEIPFDVYRKMAEKIRDNANEALLGYLKEENANIIELDTLENTINATLFELIRHDKFYYRLRSLLLNKTKSLSETAKALSVKQGDLTDFIAVASNAKMNDEKIFEAKYHLFIRGMEGVFITLNPSNKLFIKKMETYDEYKCYEVSFCHNCNALYISGNIIDGYLEQKFKSLDDLKPEVYLLNGEYDPEDDDVQDDREYIICAKCGKIKRKSSLDSLDCGHGAENYNELIKVKDAGEKLHQCPCCHVTNTQRSIVRPYFLGSEAATSVIATALYNELPDKKITIEMKKDHDEFFDEDIEITSEKVEYLSKQFLTFSDNRQAAAFFASYLESTYRDLLSRRMMTEVAEKYSNQLEQGMKLSAFVEHFQEVMTDYNIYSPDTRKKEAWIAVIKELANQKARNSLLNEEILYFDVEGLNSTKGILDLSAEQTKDLFKVFINHFFKRGCVKIPVELLREDERRLTYAGFSTGFSLEPTKSTYIEGWLPKKDKENVRTKILLKYFPKMDLDTRVKLLTSIWKQLERNERKIISLFPDRRGNSKYLVDSEKIIVKAVNKLYECNECKGKYTYSINNICPNINCKGNLHEFVRTNNNDPYYEIYRNLTIRDLVAKEHTAQLGSEKSSEYQDEFKSKKINVLSCSTTFEMGVDVGSLETVFMRNMPPSPANYAQRAGRAGRSLNAAAYSITFCGNNSHDLTFFREPVTMIKGTVNPPTFNVDNEKIVLRHVFASAFALFWKQNDDAFCRKISDFFEKNGFDRFKEYLLSKPEDLKKYLYNIVVSPELQNLYDIENFGWIDKLFSEDKNNPGIFVIAYEKYKKDILTLTNSRDELQEQINLNPDDNRLVYSKIGINNSINTIKNQQLIEFLSRNNLIPKYGFPVDTVELEAFGKNNEMANLRLDRDLFSAISEYAPESEIVADGKLIKSRYVKTLNGYSWPRYNFVECDECHTLNVDFWKKRENCAQCGSALSMNKYKQYIVPKFGFIMDNKEIKDVGTDKPERTYKGAISYIGDANQISLKNYNICNHTVHVGSSKMDELCVINDSDFYICNTCGYGKIIKSNGIKKTEEVFLHDKPDGYRCSNDKLESLALGHDFQTDVCLIEFVDLNITEVEKAWTILYSLLEGLSKYLNIDRTELSGCLHWYHNSAFNSGNYCFVLFDNTPGGAGYVRQLRKEKCFKGMLKASEYVVNSCTCGGDKKDTACYGCLCNYYNQKQHDILKRIYAIDFFNELKNGKSEWTCVISDLEELKNGLSANFDNNGQNQFDMSFEQIWNYLKDDITLKNEAELIDKIKENTKYGNYEKPYYCGTITVISSNEKIEANLLFKNSKTLLFLQNNFENYEKALETDWNCYLINEDINIKDFVGKISL